MVEFTDKEIVDFRQTLNHEVKKNPDCIFGPEKHHYEQVKPKIVPLIAYKIWEKMNKPKNKDMEIWLHAERIWDFIRYLW